MKSWFTPMVATLIAIAPAVAQEEFETRHLPPGAKPAEIPRLMSQADKARSTIIAFGRCVVQARRGVVEKVLALPLNDPGYQKGLNDLAFGGCLSGGELRLNGTLMRGGLYAALYLTDFRTHGAPLSETPVDYKVDLGGVSDSEYQQYLALHEFADCVVRTTPEAARTLVLASVGSEAETQAFALLNPSFGQCMAAGQSLEFSKIVLFGLIAEALYRESKAGALGLASATRTP